MTKRAKIAAERRSHPSESVFQLWQWYVVDHSNEYISWQYFMAICREVDRLDSVEHES